MIRIVMKLEDQFSGHLDKAQNSLQKIGGSLTSVGQQMTAGITAPVVGLGVAMFKTFADFESVMTELESRTGSTAEEMKKMEAFALEMGKTTAFSATEAAQALLELTSSGSSAAEAMEQLPAVLDLAAAGALELGAAADGVTDILAQFQLEAKDSAYVADQLAKAAGASSATVADLVAAFGNVGPVANAFGLSVNETAAALATLSENGIKGAESGTALKSMLLNMQRTTEGTALAWERLGTSMYDAQGNMRPLDDIFNDISAAMDGMSMQEQNSIASDLAGSYGVVAFNALRASSGIDSMQNAMSNAAGASAVADARMNTLAGRFDSLMGSLETLGIVLGGLGEGPLTTLITWLTNVINKITEWAQANPKLAQTVMVIVAALAALGPILVIVGSIVGAIGSISAALTAVGGMAGIAGAALAALMSPIGLLIAAGAALFLAWQTDFAGIRTLITNLWGGISEFVNQVKLASGEMGGFFTVWEDGSTRVGAILEKFGVAEDKATQMGQNFVQNSQIMAKNFQMFGEIIGLVAKKGFEWGKQLITGFVNGIKSGISSLLSAAKSMANSITNAVKGALKIKSPSQVMMKLGEQVTAGFNQGIESFGGIGVQVPALSGAGGSSAPMSSGAGSLGGGGVNINIQNLTVPPGTTQEQIDFIMKEIGKRVQRRGGK